MYQFKPLDFSKREIRVVSIEPFAAATDQIRLDSSNREIREITFDAFDATTDKIRLSLRHVSLDDCDPPKYAALSYTWGSPGPNFPSSWDDPQSTVPILLNGSDFEIRHNLASAIRHFRAITENGTFWIDAVCIDQSNDAERSEQVKLMKEIYGKSPGTVIWLGPPDSETPAAFQHLLNMSKSWRDRDPQLREHAVANEHYADYLKFYDAELSANTLPLWDAVKNLMTRSWWKRIWVMQEVFAAPTSVIYSGHHRLPFSAVFDTLSMLRQHWWCQIVAGRAKNSDDKATLMSQLLSSFDGVNRLFSCSDLDISGRPILHLHQVLWLLRPMLASEPPDKLYASLNMSVDGLGILPDYSKATCRVFTEAAMRFIENSNDLHILGYCHVGSQIEGLPSWAPDWSDRSRPGHWPLRKKFFDGYLLDDIGKEAVYFSGGKGPLEARFADDSKTLIVLGAIFQEITFVGSVSAHPGSASTSTEPSSSIENSSFRSTLGLQESVNVKIGDLMKCRWLHELVQSDNPKISDYGTLLPINDWSYKEKDGVGQFKSLIYRPTNEDSLSAYIRTLATDMVLDQERGHDCRFKDAESFNDAYGQQGFPFYALGCIPRNLCGRKFAVSYAGFFGLVPDECVVGDMLAIIKGSEVPLILRPVEQDWRRSLSRLLAPRPTRRYKLIGECYFHGIMDDWFSIVERAVGLEEISII